MNKIISVNALKNAPNPLLPSMTSTGRVGVVLVNYNGGGFLPECLQTLCASDYSEMQIVLVDNGSTDGSLEWVRQHFPLVTVLALGTNLGFTGGCNAGIAWCLEKKCDYVLLLNNDTAVAPDFLSRLMEHAGPDRLLAPKIYFYDNPTLINNHLGTYDFRRGIHRDWYYGKTDSEASRRVQEVSMANGCALLLPIGTVAKIGLFDDAFFLYAEDIDYIVRAVSAGFKVFFVPEAVVYHRESASSGGYGSPLTIYYTTRNRLHLMHKHQKNRLILGFFLVYFSVTRLLVAARYVARGQKAQLRALVFGIADFCLGRLGQAPPERYG